MYVKDSRTYTLYELHQVNPNTSFPVQGPNDEWLTNNGYTRYVPPALPAPDPEEVAAQAKASLLKSLTDAVHNLMDTKAQERNYDGIVSACSYAATVNAFQAESQAYLNWRAACWQKCYDVMADVEGGIVTIPAYVMGDPESVTPQEWLIAQLPELVLR